METASPTCKNKPKRQTNETASNAATNSFAQTGASVTRTYTAASATETINGMRKYGMRRRLTLGVRRAGPLRLDPFVWLDPLAFASSAYLCPFSALSTASKLASIFIGRLAKFEAMPRSLRLSVW